MKNMYLVHKLICCIAVVHIISGKEFKVRLADGPSNAEGRVEVEYEGKWGTICRVPYGSNYNLEWGDTEASVICRQLNFTDGVERSDNYYGSGKGPIWLYNTKCNGTEMHIGACGASGFNTKHFMCKDHDHDVGVYCTNKVRLMQNVGYGVVEIWDNNTYQLICDDGFDDIAAKLVCKYLGFQNGKTMADTTNVTMIYEIGYKTIGCQYQESVLDCINNLTNDRCLSNRHASVVCYNRPIELKLEKGEDHQGTVLINHYGKLRQLCANTFSDPDATVVCRELGFKGGFAYRRTNIYDWYYNESPTVPWIPWISNSKCSGNESNIEECGELKIGCDGPKQAASVYCFRDRGYELRLANKDNDMAGRVEISIDGQWGTICSSVFNNSAADVICRHLGYRGGKSVNNKRSRKDEQGKGPVYITTLGCSGDEKSLMECPMIINRHRIQGPLYFWYIYDYNLCSSHVYDARVQCHNSVRLSASGKPYYGILEMQVEGEWMAVCDTKFREAEANVVCRSFGYKYGKYHPGSVIVHDHNTTTEVKLHLHCKGDETRVEDCKYRTGSCSSNKYVTLFCSKQEIKTKKGLD